MSFQAKLRARLALPIMVAPMFLVRKATLVIGSCTAGVIGTPTRNHCRSDAEFEDQLATINHALMAAREENSASKGE